MLTSTTRCPNCGAAGLADGKPCRECDWLPLQSSEIIFIDDQMITCPGCSTQRPKGLKVCPQCGGNQLLDSPSQYANNYHLSTIFVVTTVVAICFALINVEPVVGIVVSALLGVSALRTAVLARERKRHRYPIAARDMRRIFGKSFVGIIAFLTIWCGVAFFFAMIVTDFVFEIHHFEIPVLVIVLAAVQVPSGILVFRGSRARQEMLAGAAVGFVVGFAVVISWSLVSLGNAWLLILLPFTSCLLGILFLLLQQKGNAKEYVTAHFSATTAVGIVGAVLEGSLRECAPTMLSILGLFLCPTLLSLLALERIWRWDDAFPIIRSRWRPNGPPIELGTVKIDDEPSQSDQLSNSSSNSQANHVADFS